MRLLSRLVDKSKYTLIITEKPDAAQKIAVALDEKENPRKMSDKGVPYYAAQRDGKMVIVVPALGHLYMVVDAEKGRQHYPAFTFKWAPKHASERNASRGRIWIRTISRLAREADTFVDACDYDIEGCIIGYHILKYACGGKEQEAKRMKYSTLTKEELQRSYCSPFAQLDFGMIEAGQARHEVDWLYGINLSRALTTAATKWSGKYSTLSTGRVQGPTLNFLATREETIRNFTPRPYWQIKAKVEIKGHVLEAKYATERIESEKQAQDIVDSIKNAHGFVAAIDAKESQQPPPFPFDLGTLQNEAYVFFKYSPRRTLEIAQQLYLKGLISYPRTDSQKLPPAIGYRAILKGLNKISAYAELSSTLLAHKTLQPHQGKKDDIAHPAIYPTGEPPRAILETSERKVWDLSVRRFMTAFGRNATRKDTTVTIAVNGERFRLNGRQILDEGWMKYYKPYIKFDEVLLPSTKKGQAVKIIKVTLEDKFTQPPPRYNQTSLLNEMEDQGIGTKATRADTIQKLYDRGYIEGERIAVTSLGLRVLEVLQSHCPIVVSPSLTRELETRMNRIQENRERKEQVLADVIRILEPALFRLKTEEETVGRNLSEALDEARLERRKIGACPVCKTGKLIINYSKKTHKRFVGCTNYFKGLCKTSFPLPQNGIVKASGKKCPACDWPTVEARIGRRSWFLCFNVECLSKKSMRR